MASTTDAPPPRDAAIAPDLSPAPPTFRSETIEGCGSAGFQTVIAAHGSIVGLATLAVTGVKGTCPTMNDPMAPVTTYDICFAESLGGAFQTTKVSTEKYLSLTGVGLAYAPTGEANIAYTGNAAGVKPAQLRCGASNLLLVAGKGGVFGAPKAIATSSKSGALVPDQAASCIMGVCDKGDATGYFPAIAFDATGTPAVAFRDLHFGFADSDFSSSDVEFARGPGFSILTIDVSRGGGSYARIAFLPSGDAAVLHYNGERELKTDGIWLNHQVAGKWIADRATPLRAGEQLGFGVSAKGVFSVAFYDAAHLRLGYLESQDGSTWSDLLAVDMDGITGQFPSLALDDSGEPAIAYYRCNDYNPNDQSCLPTRDGLFLARRRGGVWRAIEVAADPGLFDGLYPSLTFVAGKAVIAYQTRSFDPSSGKSSFRLVVAREN